VHKGCLREMNRPRCLQFLSFIFLITTSCMAQNVEESFIEAVPLQDVKLEHNSQYDKAVSLNKEYILGIETNRLLKTFRCHALSSSQVVRIWRRWGRWWIYHIYHASASLKPYMSMHSVHLAEFCQSSELRTWANSLRNLPCSSKCLLGKTAFIPVNHSHL